MLLTTGSRLGSYEILSPLGAGGMGEVYRAREWQDAATANPRGGEDVMPSCRASLQGRDSSPQPDQGALRLSDCTQAFACHLEICLGASAALGSGFTEA